MNNKSIAQRQQDLHDAFFQDRDQELLDFLEMESESAEERENERLRLVLGVSDHHVFNALKSLQVTSTSITAFMLLPLVRLAWADSRIQNGEFEFLLEAATDEGIQYGTPAYRLLNRWLEERPTPQMIEAWWQYAQALARELDETSLAAFRQATIGRALRVAESSGGILGLGEKVSENERHVLNDLAKALTKSA